MMVQSSHYDVLAFVSYGAETENGPTINYSLQARAQTLALAHQAVKHLGLTKYSIVLNICIESTVPVVQQLPGVGALPVFDPSNMDPVDLQARLIGGGSANPASSWPQASKRRPSRGR